MFRPLQFVNIILINTNIRITCVTRYSLDQWQKDRMSGLARRPTNQNVSPSVGWSSTASCQMLQRRPRNDFLRWTISWQRSRRNAECWVDHEEKSINDSLRPRGGREGRKEWSGRGVLAAQQATAAAATETESYNNNN